MLYIKIISEAPSHDTIIYRNLLYNSILARDQNYFATLPLPKIPLTSDVRHIYKTTVNPILLFIKIK